MKKISQREARRLKRRVDELEKVIKAQRNSWVSDWPGGVHIATVHLGFDAMRESAKIATARKLGHAVVATETGEKIEFRALPLPVQP